MNISLKIVSPLNYEGWDELVLSRQDYSFFHSSAWARVLHESYQYKPHYFVLIDRDKLLVLIPMMEVKSPLNQKRAVSLPFSDYCEPIIDEKVCFEDVFNYLTKYSKLCKWKSLEFRDGNHFSQEIPPSCYFYGHILDLTIGEDEIFSNVRSSTKRNIKKANKAGVTVKFCHSLDSVKKYYHLHCKTRKKHGLPPQPFYFFKKIHEHVISNNQGFVVLAHYEDNCVAGAVFFHFGSKAIYKYGASDVRFQHLRTNNLVMWEAIKWYAQHDFKSFCFGKTEPENNGLKQFKDGWGTRQQLIKYFKYDLNKDTIIKDNQKLTGFHNKIFEKLPNSVLKASGSILYKYIG